MSLPMVVLYESCIWIAWFHERRQTRAGLSALQMEYEISDLRLPITPLLHRNVRR